MFYKGVSIDFLCYKDEKSNANKHIYHKKKRLIDEHGRNNFVEVDFVCPPLFRTMKRTKTKAKKLVADLECVLFGEPTHAQKRA